MTSTRKHITILLSTLTLFGAGFSTQAQAAPVAPAAPVVQTAQPSVHSAGLISILVKGGKKVGQLLGVISDGKATYDTAKEVCRGVGHCKPKPRHRR